MAEDRAEAMLVVGALEAAEVNRPTGRDTDQAGAETDDSSSGHVRTDNAGVVTEAGTTTETPLRGCRAGGARGQHHTWQGARGIKVGQAEPGQGIPNQELWAYVRKAQAAQDALEKARKWA